MQSVPAVATEKVRCKVYLESLGKIERIYRFTLLPGVAKTIVEESKFTVYI